MRSGHTLSIRAAIAMAAVALPLSTSAQEPDAEARQPAVSEGPDLALFNLEYQPALRSDSQSGPNPGLVSGGFSPLRFSFSGAGFWRWPIGIAVSVTRESYALQGSFGDTPISVPFVLYGAAVGLAGRARIGMLRIGGVAGYAYDDLAVVDPFGTSVQPATAHRQAVLLAANFGLQITPRLLAQAEGRVPLALSTTSSLGSLNSL
jgi:hypothetical protein